MRYFSSVLILMLLVQCSKERSLGRHVFERGIISTDAVEYASAFSPSGDTLYFARSNGKWGKGPLKSTIYYAVKKNGIWSEPVPASFSGLYNDSDPHVSKDGKQLYFISDRPSGAAERSKDIWCITKGKTGQWDTPVWLGNIINSTGTEYSPRTTQNGDLYFASDRPGGLGQGDLYVARKKEDGFEAPVNLGPVLNSATGEWNLEVDDHGTMIIFEASQRSENITSYGDLYISFKQGGQWTMPQHIMGLNTSGSDLYPELANDNTILYFTSSDSLSSTSTQLYYTNFKPLYKRYKQQARLPE